MPDEADSEAGELELGVEAGAELEELDPPHPARTRTSDTAAKPASRRICERIALAIACSLLCSSESSALPSAAATDH